VSELGQTTMGENTLTLAADKLYTILLVVALITGFAFSLGSVGRLLGFNATTLTLIALAFSAMSANFWLYGPVKLDTEGQLQTVSLAIIPIALRWAFQMPIFQEFMAAASVAEGETMRQLGYMIQVLALWVLVAVSEEAFRAAMLNFADLFARFKDTEVAWYWRVLFANTVWVGFHFLQRPFNLKLYAPYILWLYAAGLVMTWALIKQGLGAATLIHVVINLTA